MNTKNSMVAIIPARAGSKGLPGKNLRHLVGRPLVTWPIAAALGAGSINRVIVSTDDDEIANVSRAAGADVPFIRPGYLADDNASSMDVVLHAIDELEKLGEKYEYLILLEPTSPLTESTDIDAAFSQLKSATNAADAIVGVCRVESTHPEYDVRIDENGFLSPYLAPNFKSLRRRQEIEKIYFLEGSLYISSVEAFRRNRTFYHNRTLGYQVPRWKSIEVDELIDFIFVEAIMKSRDEIRQQGHVAL
jgi:CMP-N,N'-diacetyllegionaminic acid synthase